MEDEDGESKVMDMWSILGEQQLKDTTLGNSLKPSIDNAYTDVIEEEKQLLRYNSITTKDSPSKNTNAGSKIVFKGFKKRILAQAQETQTITSKNSAQEQQLLHSNASPKNAKEKRTEAKRGKITEYAQYLGLQPSSKYKCSKCHSSTNFSSTLKQSLCTCNPTMTPMPSTSESSTVPHPANFKITRKVYLCAACGTYFENWNLFLHMRDIHKRHICLFCLGMFGQAERLSCHLIKKHSVPEMAFTSVEDFYGAFKGSCYLVCCTCEKVFSETDNFYNHFCSPASKQDVTASICTLCRQTGTHASTCSLVIDTSNEVTATSPTSTQSNAIAAHLLERPMNIGNKTASKKAIKNNRVKYAEDSAPSLHQQKANMHAKKTNMKSVTPQPNESQVHGDAVAERERDESSQSEVMYNSIRDTVSETIMEVSRYVGDSCDEIEEKSDQDVCQDRITEVRSPASTISHNDALDSVSQTIMEVSRCENNMQDVEDTKKDDTGSIDIFDISDKHDSDSDDTTRLDTDAFSSTREDTRLGDTSPVHQQPDESGPENITAESLSETRGDSGSQASESPVYSPVNRSLFSPQNELHTTDLQSKDESYESESKEEKLDVPTESQTSVSFNAVASSDRSLVIKICTNRNSQFSVATAISNDNGESHDFSRESEENNNAEGSAAEEKISNVSERERDSNSSYQANDGDSDSDSDKLAVVDSNPEEAEEVDDNDDLESTPELRAESNVDAGEETINVEEIKEEERMADISANGRDDIRDDVSNTSDVNNAMPGTIEPSLQPADGIVLAGEDVPSMDLNVEGTLDSIEIEDLLKRCIETASPICVYCNHARHIAVNGKQLGLHMLAEHKFQPQHPAIIIQSEQFTIRVKKSLDEVESHFFNLNSYSSTNGTYNVPDVRTYECFHCRFHSSVHKELYLHNRKMHQKTILICIMCKSTFYSYSELLCHLCPGTYSPNINVKYRCCLCPVASLPSAFRLMVHLRKRHHACDVCLESTGNQQRLSNHVWKHKLHHLCYRCGIAYRNKPDITKHLFWKHGTESVLCKKCLQKKWPHIYHFCIPPTAFVCEECGSSFSRAVALKVHKRLHSGDQPYNCGECSAHFISQKLLERHENSHKEQPPVDVTMVDVVNQPPVIDDEKSDKEKIIVVDNVTTAVDPVKDSKETVKKVVDVYDLPPLNLSSESDTDSEEEKTETKEPEVTEKEKPVDQSVTSPVEASKAASPGPAADSVVEVEQNEEDKEQGAQIMDGIWDNFKSYAASLEVKESGNNFTINEQESETDVALLRSIVLADHDYCVVWSNKDKDGEADSKEDGAREQTNCTDQDLANKTQRSPSDSNVLQNPSENDSSKKKVKTPKKKKQSGSTSSSDSSSDSDSSSCSCGTNCSCSSSSSGSSSSSSSSSDSDSSASESSPRKQSNRKERKKEKEAAQEPKAGSVEPENKEIPTEAENGVLAAPIEPVCVTQLSLRESDLETDETETDEDFYDEHPQQLANKLLAEKRNQLLLLAAVAPASAESSIPLNNGITDAESVIPSPDPMSASVEDQPQQKRKVKTKKRKKGERTKQRNATPTVESIKLNIPKAFYQKNPGFAASSPVVMPSHPSRSSTPSFSTNDIHGANTGVESQSMGMTNQSIGGSGSETENKRSSKRKRVPKRFYGDSSDEEADKQPAIKWRKVEPSSFVPAPSLKPVQPRLSFGGKTVAYRPMENTTENLPVAAASATESEEPAESSSESSDSEVEASLPAQTHLPETHAPLPERSVNLYCYCQCPYDEVSEMIACDGEDCRIEWFHFECVGIMVPPKGKWYCPDCRKKHGIVQNSEDYFD